MMVLLVFFSELKNCSSKNVDFDRCQCIAAIDESYLATIKVKWFIDWINKIILSLKRRNVHNSPPIEMNPCHERNFARKQLAIAKLLR